MPNLVAPLNESYAYVYCPVCRQNGTNNSMLSRSMHTFTCQFGHKFQSWAEVERMSPDMVPESEIVQEQPNPEAMKWAVYVMPRVREIIETKYKGRVFTTVGTLLDSLADDSVIILQGSEAKELRKRNIINGTQIIAALDSFKNMERERQDALDKMTRMSRLIAEATGQTEP